MPKKIRISIVDNSPVVITGIETILSTDKEFEIIGKFHHTAALEDQLKQHTPDIIISEAEIEGISAKEELMLLKRMGIDSKLVVFTNFESIQYVKMIMRSGAVGFILKTGSEVNLLNALKIVYGGEVFIDPSLRETIFQKTMLNKKTLAGHKVLTKREKEILQLLASNYNSREISEKLFLSQKTVENHRSNMLLKFKVKNAASLIMKAIELGLLE